MSEIDKYFPYRGKCAFCGADDARHRLWDSIIDMHKAGDSIEHLAEDFNLPIEAIKLVIKEKEEQKNE